MTKSRDALHIKINHSATMHENLIDVVYLHILQLVLTVYIYMPISYTCHTQSWLFCLQGHFNCCFCRCYDSHRVYRAIPASVEAQDALDREIKQGGNCEFMKEAHK